MNLKSNRRKLKNITYGLFKEQRDDVHVDTIGLQGKDYLGLRLDLAMSYFRESILSQTEVGSVTCRQLK
jgi:hypothetical protein